MRGCCSAAVAGGVLRPRMGRTAHSFAVAAAAAATLAAGVARAAADNAPPAADDAAALWKFSCYAFRDVDRSGVFDMGDKPFADLAIVLTPPGGAETVQFSNVDGFANFSTATGGGAGIDVARPGPYRLHAEAPPGFVATAGGEQTLVFREDAVVPGGLAIEESCAPVGVAPDLAVSGRVAPPPGAGIADVTLTLADATGAAETVAPDQDGRFAVAGRPGTFTLIARHAPSGSSQARQVVVARHAVRLSEIDLGAATKPGAETLAHGPERIIGFDDLVGAGGIFEVPSGYGGLSWRNLIAVHNRFYDGPGYVNGTESGEFVAYNSSGAPASVWRDQPFDFRGAHVAVAWPRGAEGDVIVKAWHGDDQVHEDRLAVSPGGGTFFAADYRGVTRVEFSHDLHERIVLDDLRIAE